MESFSFKNTAGLSEKAAQIAAKVAGEAASQKKEGELVTKAAEFASHGFEHLVKGVEPPMPEASAEAGALTGGDAIIAGLGDELAKIAGMGAAIAADAEDKIRSLEGVSDALVEVVWDPPWNPRMISEAGREKLGI